VASILSVIIEHSIQTAANLAATNRAKATVVFAKPGEMCRKETDE
jgi:hypothetical protein